MGGDQEEAMRRLIAFAASFVFIATAAVQAHEGHAHKMMGTVKAVHADMNHVELTTADGKTSGFYVTSDTKYLKGSAAASLADLKPGTRVVVEAATEGTKMIAKSVRLSEGTKKAAAAAPAHKH
jgi:hypothetical protein